ncbi:hypothetical protein EJ04DRAFT_96345 [Polyplosphaeria fusca]|uniref:Uncharacterized protein n=1 Tax=Polyplosphaeria fusca TaxID=682080 RepID=A0A9P4UU39_9PLEO|nr:hypothetical protein EJ04DRAFT_96345 [Polyplosphaeria fusca]
MARVSPSGSHAQSVRNVTPLHHAALASISPSFDGRAETEAFSLLSAPTSPTPLKDTPDIEELGSQIAVSRPALPFIPDMAPLATGRESYAQPHPSGHGFISEEGIGGTYVHAPPDDDARMRYSSQRVDALEEEVEIIQDARDDLTGSRFGLKTQRQSLTALRRKTGTLEGALMKLLRSIIEDGNVEMQKQQELNDMHAQLLALRDELGIAEDLYEQAEDSYNRQEWQYTQQETNFIDKLRSSDSPTSGRSLEVTRTFEIDNLVFGSGQAGGHSPPHVENCATHELPPIMQVELSPFAAPNALQNPEEFISAVTGNNPVEGVSTSRRIVPRSPEHTPHISQPHSDQYLMQAQITWLGVKRRIEHWLLDILLNSQLQQAQLKDLVPQDDLDDQSWQRLIEEHWESDTADSNFKMLAIDNSVISQEPVSATASPSSMSSTRDFHSHSPIKRDMAAITDMRGNNYGPRGMIPFIIEPLRLTSVTSRVPQSQALPTRNDTPFGSDEGVTSRKPSDADNVLELLPRFDDRLPASNDSVVRSSATKQSGTSNVEGLVYLDKSPARVEDDRLGCEAVKERDVCTKFYFHPNGSKHIRANSEGRRHDPLYGSPIHRSKSSPGQLRGYTTAPLDAFGAKRFSTCLSPEDAK